MRHTFKEPEMETKRQNESNIGDSDHMKVCMAIEYMWVSQNSPWEEGNDTKNNTNKWQRMHATYNLPTPS